MGEFELLYWKDILGIAQAQDAKKVVILDKDGNKLEDSFAEKIPPDIRLDVLKLKGKDGTLEVTLKAIPEMVVVQEAKATEKATRKVAGKEIINLMPCPVNLILEDSERVFPVSGKVARCIHYFEPKESFNGVPIKSRKIGNVTGLPEEVHGTKYIVMQKVAEARPERRDLLVPMMPERDAKGNIKGYHCLAELF